MFQGSLKAKISVSLAIKTFNDTKWFVIVINNYI